MFVIVEDVQFYYFVLIPALASSKHQRIRVRVRYLSNIKSSNSQYVTKQDKNKILQPQKIVDIDKLFENDSLNERPKRKASNTVYSTPKISLDIYSNPSESQNKSHRN